MPKLTADIIGNFKRTVYGKAGDEVKIISKSDTVLIVENEEGSRFPVLVSEVTEDPSISESPGPPPIAKEQPVPESPRKKANKKNDHSTLF